MKQNKKNRISTSPAQKTTIRFTLDDTERLIAVGKALSVPARIEILKLLCKIDLNINEISERLEIPASSAALHIKVLEEAGIIRTELQSGVRGARRVCKKQMEYTGIELITEDSLGEKVEIISMPVGEYVDCKVEPTCGIAAEKAIIGEEDEPRCFYHPLRMEAKLLWFGKGYVEYRFPNHVLQGKKEHKMELSMELCSEDQEYNMNHPSDITVWINGIEAGTWRSPSDFGGRRGNCNPDWWSDKNTQYGMLKTWKLTEKGTYLDANKVSENSLENYGLAKDDYISVKIGIKEDAKYQGGVNLFGDGFGDYPQNIVMKFFF